MIRRVRRWFRRQNIAAAQARVQDAQDEMRHAQQNLTDANARLRELTS